MMSDDQNSQFDEFDNLVDDDMAFQDEPFPEELPRKKKSTTGFYLLLLIIVGLSGGAAWFLFLRAPQTSALNTPDAMTAPMQETADAPALPPGISVADAPSEEDALPSYDDARQELASISDDTASSMDDGLNDSMQTPAAAEDESIAEAEAPTEAPLEPSPVTGMTAEALPPPVALSATPDADTAAQNDLPLIDADVEEPTIAAELPSDAIPAEQDAAPQIAEEPQAATAPIAADTPAEAIESSAPTSTMPTPPQDVQNNAIADERLAQVEERVRNLSSELQAAKDTVQRLSEQPLQTSSSTAPAVDAGLQQELRALSDKLESLSKQVDSLDQRTTTLATELQNQNNAPAPAAAPLKAETKPVAQEPEKQEPAIKAVEAPAPKPVAKTVVKPAPKPAAKAVTKPAGSTTLGGWELRSAQPGVAWLGRKGSSEMTRYAVGRDVPGLGTIKAVHQQGGLWVVETSNGTLRQ